VTERIKQPYVGVSGVVSPEIQATLELLAVETGLIDTGRALALGVKAVHKTQFLDVPNKYGNDWYPVGEESFNGALHHGAKSQHTIGVAQAYFDPQSVHSEEYRMSFLKRIIQRGKPWLEAIQFDMLPWHSDADVWDMVERTKECGISVIMQVHSHAMASLGAKATARVLARRSNLLDYVLFDASHGTGTKLDVIALEPFLAGAHEHLDLQQTGVAIAGGLDGVVIREDLPYLLNIFPNISWDAEGKLHPMIANGKRPLDLNSARAYLEASAEVILQ